MTCQVNMLNSCRSQHVQSCRNEPFLLHPKFSPSSRFHITIFRPSTAPSLMAFVQVDVDLQTLFQPLLASQRELMRAIEIICQIDDLSDFTEDVELQAATAHLRLVRQPLDQVCAVLRLRLTIHMVQLARRFREHFRRQSQIPIVNLDFRWPASSWDLQFFSRFGLPTAIVRQRGERLLSCNPIDKKTSGSGYHGLFLQKKLHTNCDITAWMLSRNIRKSFWRIALPSKSWAPYEAGTQNKWPCGWLRRSERLDRAVQAGQTRKALKYVEQRQVMVASYKFCNERPEQRAGVRCMMQSLDDVSNSEDE